MRLFMRSQILSEYLITTKVSFASLQTTRTGSNMTDELRTSGWDKLFCNKDRTSAAGKSIKRIRSKRMKTDI